MKESLLETLLDPHRLRVCFQPIFRIHERLHQIHALEALVRGPRGTNFERADILFDYVRRKRSEAAMDRTCFAAICKAASAVPPQFRINVNVHAVTLGQKPGFVDFFWKLAERHALSLDRITIEIVEHAPSCNVPALMDTVTSLRDSGVRIALDDIGLGQSNYRMMLDCQPEYFKLDAYFVRGLRHYPRRRAVVESLTTLAAAMQGSVVAEGVESAEDLVELKRLGVEFVQANLLCSAMSLEDLWATGLLGFDRGTPPTAEDAGIRDRVLYLPQSPSSVA
ncbi:MAG TPA: EAL domain-containing protein [Terriglobales bacterium]|jgi:EAL domain-containing protein (putative c-di-GMP-specific phosphodiesterase class I)